MLNALEGAQNGAHLCGRHPGKERHRRRREYVFHVMCTGDAQFIGGNQDMLRAVPANDDHAVRTDARALRQFLPAAEQTDAPRRALRHAARMRIIGVQYEVVLRCLCGEKLFLHRLIDLHRAMAHDVIRRDVQLRDDVCMKMRGRFHLIA